MGSTAAAGVGVERWSRDMPPAHFIFKIRSFSLLSETGVDRIESGVFEACDKKWKLCVVYPEGELTEKDDDNEEHISLYLQIVDTDEFPAGWEVHAKFSLFVYDHVHDKYLTIQDAGGKTRRFNCMKTEHGFDGLLPWSTFKDPSNGYLINDTCAFGAEILSISSATKHECLSLVKEPIKKGTYTWTIDGFTLKKRESRIRSHEFTVEGRKWKLLLYPSGDSRANGRYLSLFLELLNFEDIIVHGRKVYAKFILRIRNQLGIVEHKEAEVNGFFDGSDGWGGSKFLLLSEVESSSKGFLVKDSLIVEVEFKLLSKYL
ncbi:unnamed protein product [Cuscuta europaea]|uniref:MATH domain-containing protein n=2 Tax=Cuscuta europaea TaxID=41803 RepID=A0A9P1DYQ1_CUSEU|nr:unnamed protein product [Cuscuta europaea]